MFYDFLKRCEAHFVGEKKKREISLSPYEEKSNLISPRKCKREKELIITRKNLPRRISSSSFFIY